MDLEHCKTTKSLVEVLEVQIKSDVFKENAVFWAPKT